MAQQAIWTGVPRGYLCGSRLDRSNSSVVWRCRDGTATEVCSTLRRSAWPPKIAHTSKHIATQRSAQQRSMPCRGIFRHAISAPRGAMRCCSTRRVHGCSTARQLDKTNGMLHVERGARLVRVRWEWAEKAPRVVHGREAVWTERRRENDMESEASPNDLSTNSPLPNIF